MKAVILSSNLSDTGEPSPSLSILRDGRLLCVLYELLLEVWPVCRFRHQDT